MTTMDSPAQKITRAEPTLQDARERLRQAAPRLRDLVVQEIRANTVEMVGPFSSMRQIPALAEQIVAQFLDVVSDGITAAEMQERLQSWVQRGLGPQGAFAIADTLFDAGMEIDKCLAPALTNYRRWFTTGYEAARRTEILRDQERMQRSLSAALERQISSERALRASLQRRQGQLELAAELARLTGSTRDLDELLSVAVRHLFETLQLDFVGIYLLDDFQSWAVLRAGSGAAGSALLTQGYQIKLDTDSPLSRAANQGEPLLLVDGKFRGSLFVQPLLPAMAQAIVAPLVTRGQSLGFLTLHSQDRDKFTSQDLTVLSIIADNLGHAIENAQLFAQAQSNLQELERAQRGFVRESWADESLTKKIVYSQTADKFDLETVQAQSVLSESGNGSAPDGALSVPITLRGQVIGTVDLIDVTQARNWSESDKALASSVVEQMALAVENARLFEQSRQRAQELTAINEITNVISQQLHIDRLLAEVHAQVERVMPADAFFVSLYDEANDSIAYPFIYDDGKRYESPSAPLAPRGSLRQVVNTGKSILINRTPQEISEARARMNSETAMGDMSKVSASLLYAPLRLGERVVGVISAQSYEPNAYSPRDVELLEGIGIHVAVALQNARLFEATQTRAQETAIINEMARELSGELDQDNLFGIVYKYLPRLMPMDAFIVWFYDAASNTITRPALYDLGVKYPPAMTPVAPTDRLVQILETNEALTINRSRQELENEAGDTRDTMGSLQIAASLLYAPLRIGNQIRGFVSVQSYEFNAYGGPQAALLQSISSYLATALENLRLFQEIQAALSETQLLYRIGAQLNQVTSLDELVRIAAQPGFEQGAGSAQLLLMEYQGAGNPVAANVVVSLVAPGEPAVLSGYVHFPIREFQLGQAMLANPRELVMIENVETHPQLDASTRRVLLESNDRAVVLLPLSVEQRILGAIAIGWAVPHSFNLQERRVYQALASQLALVLNNRLLFEQTEQALAETQTLYEIGARLNAATTLQEALEAAAGPAIVMGAVSASLLHVHTDSQGEPQELELLATWPRDPNNPLAVGARFGAEFLSGDRSWIEQPNEPRVLSDIENDPDISQAAKQLYMARGLKASALLPLKIGSRWIGMLSQSWQEPHNFTARDIRLFRSIMGQTATVMDNRALFAQTQAALALTENLYRASQALSAASDLQELVRAVAESVRIPSVNRAVLLILERDENDELDSMHVAANWYSGEGLEPTPVGTNYPRQIFQAIPIVLGRTVEFFNDTSNEQRLDPSSRALFARQQIVSVALMPLWVGGMQRGALLLETQTPHVFTDDETRALVSLAPQLAIAIENRRLFDATQEALAQTQDALNQVQEAQERLNLQYQTANILARATSFGQAAPLLLQNTCRSLNWQMGEYWTVDETFNRLVLSHVWTEDDPELQDFASDSYGLTFGPGEGLAGRTWAEGQPIWVADLATDTGFKQLGKATRAGLVSALAFPLQSEARQFGVTVFFSTHPQVMDDTLMTTMIGVGSQIGQYIERRRAEEAVRQQNTYLTALHDTTLGLMGRLDLDELLQNIITRAGELVGTEHGYVHLIEPSGNELRMRVGIGIYQDFIGTRVKMGQGLAGTVWRNEEAIVVDDYRNWQGRLPMVDRDVLRAVVGVPLKSGNQTVGVLGLASLEEGRKFSTAQTEALERFAELAAVALDNAQLYNSTQQALQQTQRLAQREKASAEIADKLYAAPDVKSVLQTAAQELLRNTGSRRAVVRLNLGKNGKANDKDSVAASAEPDTTV